MCGRRDIEKGGLLTDLGPYEQVSTVQMAHRSKQQQKDAAFLNSANWGIPFQLSDDHIFRTIREVPPDGGPNCVLHIDAKRGMILLLATTSIAADTELLWSGHLRFPAHVKLPLPLLEPPSEPINLHSTAVASAAADGAMKTPPPPPSTTIKTRASAAAAAAAGDSGDADEGEPEPESTGGVSEPSGRSAKFTKEEILEHCRWIARNIGSFKVTRDTIRSLEKYSLRCGYHANRFRYFVMNQQNKNPALLARLLQDNPYNPDGGGSDADVTITAAPPRPPAAASASQKRKRNSTAAQVLMSLSDPSAASGGGDTKAAGGGTGRKRRKSTPVNATATGTKDAAGVVSDAPPAAAAADGGGAGGHSSPKRVETTAAGGGGSAGGSAAAAASAASESGGAAKYVDELSRMLVSSTSKRATEVARLQKIRSELTETHKQYAQKRTALQAELKKLDDEERARFHWLLWMRKSKRRNKRWHYFVGSCLLLSTQFVQPLFVWTVMTTIRSRSLFSPFSSPHSIFSFL